LLIFFISKINVATLKFKHLYLYQQKRLSSYPLNLQTQTNITHNLIQTTNQFITMKKVLFTLLAAGLSLTGFAQKSTWDVDAAHTSVHFTVPHLVISEAEGNFKVFNGSVESPSADFENAVIKFDIDVTSINTDNEMRDKHLKSEDFFAADKFPKANFVSKSFKKVKGNLYKLTGDLTLRGVTKTVTFDVTYNGAGKDAYGRTVAAFKMKGKINRMEYGIKWNNAVEAGAAVGEEVELTSRIELVKKA
jgi:polyisoprenoid-binding protein YceI